MVAFVSTWTVDVPTCRTTDLAPAEVAPVWQHSRRISRIAGESARASDIYNLEKFGHNKTTIRICPIVYPAVENASWFRILPAKRSVTPSAMFSLFVRQALARRPALNALTNLVGRLPTLSSSQATLPALVVAARPRFFSLSTPLAFPTTKKKTTKKVTTSAGRKKPTKTSPAKKKTAGVASKSKTKSKKPAPKKTVAKKKAAVAKPKKVVAKKVVPKKVVPTVQTPRNTRQFPTLCTLFYLWLILESGNSPPSSSSASNARVWYLLPTHVPYSESQARQYQGGIPNRPENVGGSQ